MKYTKEERLVIGRQIYDGEFSVQGAAEEYGISFYTARVYLRTFKAQLRPAVPDIPESAGFCEGGSTGSFGDGTSASSGNAAAAGASGKAKLSAAQGAVPGMNLYRAHLRHLTREQLENELVEMKQREERIRQLLE